jgi:hypothetical protein
MECFASADRFDQSDCLGSSDRQNISRHLRLLRA